MSEPTASELRDLVDDAEASRIRNLADRLNTENGPVHEAVKALRDYATALEYGQVGPANTRAAKPAVKLPQVHMHEYASDGFYFDHDEMLAALTAAGIDIQPLPEGPRS